MCVGIPRPVHKKPLTHNMAPLFQNKSVPKKRTNNKSVVFAPVESTVASYIPARCDLEEPEHASVWYGRSELEAIKSRARDDAQRAMRQSHPTDQESRACPQPAPSQPQCDDLDDGDNEDLASCPRGFELCLSPLRLRNRALAQMVTLQFARRLKRQEEEHCCNDDSPRRSGVDPAVRLALVSSKLSRWSREIALSAGYGDFLDAYEAFKGVLPGPRSLEEISREHRFPLGVKRSAMTPPPCTDGEERRVRRKVC